MPNMSHFLRYFKKNESKQVLCAPEGRLELFIRAIFLSPTNLSAEVK
jgi:hypothetical protein